MDPLWNAGTHTHTHIYIYVYIYIYGRNASHIVHGLTTAASLWLSAAVGIACGGGLFFPASFSTAIILVLLRFGPRFNHEDEESDDNATDLEYNSTSSVGITKKKDDTAYATESKSLIYRKSTAVLNRPQLV